MQCPKCKQEIKDNSIKCNFCGSKVGSLCKVCGSYNPITASECAECGKILIRFCEDCGAANLPEATSCRKCGNTFTKNEAKKVPEKPEYYAATNSQQKIRAKLLEGIKNADSQA